MSPAQFIAMICPEATKGAEIGVWRGKTSLALLQRLPRLELVMVDPWEVPEKGDSYYDSDKTSRYDKEKFDQAYQQVKEKVQARNAIIERMTSCEASQKYDDYSFDFVFIDGDHSYEGVKRDIHLWKPKVKPGGWLIGHDYYHHSGMDDVRRAVSELLPSHKVETRNDQGIWYIRL